MPPASSRAGPSVPLTIRTGLRPVRRERGFRLVGSTTRGGRGGQRGSEDPSSRRPTPTTARRGASRAVRTGLRPVWRRLIAILIQRENPAVHSSCRIGSERPSIRCERRSVFVYLIKEHVINAIKFGDQYPRYAACGKVRQLLFTTGRISSRVCGVLDPAYEYDRIDVGPNDHQYRGLKYISHIISLDV